MKNILAFALVFVSFSVTTLAQVAAKGWNGIEPLSSTRIDVERLFGKPVRSGNEVFYQWIYKTPDGGTLNVRYSEGKCGENTRSILNVPRNTVISFSISPVKPQTFREIRILYPSLFLGFVDPHMPDQIHYSSENGMIRFTMRQKENPAGTIESLSFYPTVSEEQRFRCHRT